MFINLTAYVAFVSEDTMMPVISGCPASITEETTLEARTCLASWQEPMVSDNSLVVNLVSQSHMSNTLFNEGTTVVTYTYADPTGNQASCSFTVTCTPGDDLFHLLFDLSQQRFDIGIDKK